MTVHFYRVSVKYLRFLVNNEPSINFIQDRKIIIFDSEKKTNIMPLFQNTVLYKYVERRIQVLQSEIGQMVYQIEGLTKGKIKITEVYSILER